MAKDPRFDPRLIRKKTDESKKEDRTDDKILGKEIANNTILTDHLVNGAVSTDKIANGAVTPAKLSSDWPIFSVYSDLYISGGIKYTTDVIYQASTAFGIISVVNSPYFTPANGRFTAPFAGYYYFSGQFSRSQGNATLEIFKGVSSLGIRSLSYGADWNTASVSCITYLNKDEYVYLRFGATNGTTTYGYRINFSGHLVR